MLQNAYLVAKIGADTAENEQHFAEILPIGRRVADRSSSKEVLDEPGRGRRPRRACAGHRRHRHVVQGLPAAAALAWPARLGTVGLALGATVGDPYDADDF